MVPVWDLPTAAPAAAGTTTEVGQHHHDYNYDNEMMGDSLQDPLVKQLAFKLQKVSAAAAAASAAAASAASARTTTTNRR